MNFFQYNDVADRLAYKILDFRQKNMSLQPTTTENWWAICRGGNPISEVRIKKDHHPHAKKTLMKWCENHSVEWSDNDDPVKRIERDHDKMVVDNMKKYINDWERLMKD